MADQMRIVTRDWATEAADEVRAEFVRAHGFNPRVDSERLSQVIRKHGSKVENWIHPGVDAMLRRTEHDAKECVTTGQFTTAEAETSRAIRPSPFDVFRPVWSKHKAELRQIGLLLCDTGPLMGMDFLSPHDAEIYVIGVMFAFLASRRVRFWVLPRGKVLDLRCSNGNKHEHRIEAKTPIEALALLCLKLDSHPFQKPDIYDAAAAAGEEIDRLVFEEMTQRHGPGAYRPGKLGVAAIIRKHLQPTQPLDHTSDAVPYEIKGLAGLTE